jgi:hypothetical protein
MFNLEHAIAEWRQQMVEGGIDSSTTLDELEGHLRDEVERQTKFGTDASHAFANAVKRIGPPTTIKAEFKKVETSIPRWFMRYYCGWVPVFYLCLASYILLKAPMSSGERASGFAAVWLFCLLIRRVPQYHRFLPVISNRRLRLAIQFGCFLIWMAPVGVFVNLILPQLNLTLGQEVVAFQWVMTSSAPLTGIFLGLDEAAHRTNRETPRLT